MTVLYAVMAVNGFIMLLFGYLSDPENLPKRKVSIIVGWTIFLGCSILVIEKLFLK
jgi:hypothetical protein